MAAQPDRIRAAIEQTREDLTEDVDRLADRTSPKRIVRRRWDGVRSRARNVKESVMGTSEDATAALGDQASAMGDKVSSAGSAVATAVRESPETVARKARGNPLATGLIAFGAGLLAASLLPETEAERRWSRQVSDQAGAAWEPVRESVQESVRQLGTDVGEAAKEAADQVGETAREAARETADAAKDAAQATAAHPTKESVSGP